MKDLIQTLLTKDHIESVLHKLLIAVGTWMISNGMMTAGGSEQFATGGATIAAGLIFNFIASHEKKADDKLAEVSVVSPVAIAAGIVKSN